MKVSRRQNYQSMIIEKAEQTIRISLCTVTFLNMICSEAKEPQEEEVKHQRLREHYQYIATPPLPGFCFTNSSLYEVKFQPFERSNFVHRHIFQLNKSYI